MARKVEDLATWRLCDELVRKLSEVTETPRVSAHVRFCDQLNDAAADALSDVAEGFARFYPRDFAKFLDYALSSLEEVRTRVAAGYHRKYFDERVTSDLLSLCMRAEGAARNLRAYLWTVDRNDLPPRPKSRPTNRPDRAGRGRRRRNEDV